MDADSDREDLFGKRLSRDVYVEHVRDTNGDEALTGLNSANVAEGWDGTIERIFTRGRVTLWCKHLYKPGDDSIASCDLCSKEAGRSVFVCEQCRANCALCGKSLCIAHTRPTPDGMRYCKMCFRKGQKLALEKLGRTGQPGILGRALASILEWW